MSDPRNARLRNTYNAVKVLADKCTTIDFGKGPLPRFEFKHNGKIEADEYPDMYGITLRVKGVESLHPLRERYEHQCTIYLPVNYPVEHPLIKWHTPIFHPNILMFDENNQSYQNLLENIDSEEALTEDINTNPDWLNVLDGYVCLNTLREDWTPAVGLDDLIIELTNMIRYQTYSASPGKAFNKAAAKWAREKEEIPGQLPLDNGLTEIEEVIGVEVIDVKGLL